MTTATSGASIHPPDDLSDVIITEPITPKYAFDQVWHAGLIARATGYRGGGGKQLADFLEALAYGYDATRRLADLDSDWTSGIRTTDLRGRIVEQLQAGESIVDLPNILGDSFARILAALTHEQSSLVWTWSELQWIEFETYIMSSDKHSDFELHRKFHMGRRQAASLIEAYGKTVGEARSKDRAKKAEAIVVKYLDRSNVEVEARLADEGLEYSQASIRKIRQRIKERAVA